MLQRVLVSCSGTVVIAWLLQLGGDESVRDD